MFLSLNRTKHLLRWLNFAAADVFLSPDKTIGIYREELNFTRNNVFLSLGRLSIFIDWPNFERDNVFLSLGRIRHLHRLANFFEGQCVSTTWQE